MFTPQRIAYPNYEKTVTHEKALFSRTCVRTTFTLYTVTCLFVYAIFIFLYYYH
jgi:hypothetical protein